MLHIGQDFYILENRSPNGRFRLACRIVEKAYLKNNNIYLLTKNVEDSDILNDLLWTFSQSSFVPHQLEIAGKNIIIVEDIIDSGNTINFVKEFIDNKNPKSLKIATLLLKPKTAKLSFKIDWVGFEISPEFVVGYGLDYNQKLRNLNAVYRLGGVN